MGNNFYAILVFSIGLLNIVILFSSFISNCSGYGLLPPFSKSFPPDSPFFEVRSGYWLYSCLFHDDCVERERALANHFGYGSEWYYDTCDYSTGNDSMWDRPVRCRRIVQQYPRPTNTSKIYINPPGTASPDKFIQRLNNFGAEQLCAKCSEDRVESEGYTDLFYIECKCDRKCWVLKLDDVEDDIVLRGTEVVKVPCHLLANETISAYCNCELKRAGFSSEAMGCKPPLFSC